MTEMSEHMGKQVACRHCEANDDDIRTSLGLRNPDAAYRWAPKPNPYVERALISEAEAREIERNNAIADALMDEDEEDND